MPGPSTLPPFELERYFAEHEFTAPYLMCCSDVEPLTLKELLELADDEGRQWWDQLSLGYTDYPGDVRLRQEIAHLYKGVDESQIYCFCGAQEAIFLLFQVLLRGPGAHAIVTWPGYQSLYSVASAAGAEVSLLELREEEDWELPLERLKQAWRPTTRLVAINFPHNPTGSVLSPTALREVAAFCQERGAWLFSDEVYLGLEWSTGVSAHAKPSLAGPCSPGTLNSMRNLPSAGPAVEVQACAISLGVMSKSFGLAGLRLGWLACRDAQVLRQVAQLKDYSTICNASPSEALAFMGLRARLTLWERSRRLVEHNAGLFESFLKQRPDLLSWVRPRAGTMGFPRLAPGLPVGPFAQDLRRGQGVLILPGEVYGYAGNHFRVGLGRRNFPQVFERFRQFLEQQ